MEFGGFNPLEWIGVKKKWIPDDIPDYVKNAKDIASAIPATIQASFIPESTLDVKSWLQYKLPPLSNNIVAVKIQHCFSTEDPVTDVEALRKTPIPDPNTLQRLDKALGQAWLDGKKSYVDWRFRKANPRDLWMIRYWLRIRPIVVQQEIWSKGYKRIEGLKDVDNPNQSRAKKIYDMLTILPWNVQLPLLRGATTTSSLGPFLTEKQWLVSDHIDMMVVTQAARGVKAGTELVPLVFIEYVGTNRGSKYLQRLVTRVHEGRLKHLYFPANVRNNHWIAFHINFEEETYEYGDSLGELSGRPRKVIKSLEKWFRAAFRTSFRCTGNTLIHATQEDSWNCGLYAINTISHAVFGDPLLTSNNTTQCRLEWFLQLVASLEDANLVNRLSAPTLADLLNPAPATPEVVEPDTISIASSSDTDGTSDESSTGGDVVRCPIDEVSSTETETDYGDLAESQAESDAGSEMDVEENGGSGVSLGEETSILHKRGKQDIDSGPDSDDEEAPSPKRAKPPRSHLILGTGISKSAKASLKVRSAVRDGTYRWNRSKYEAWQAHIQTMDPNAMFDDKNWLVAICSLCPGKAAVVTAKEPYDKTRWNHHWTGKHAGKKTDALRQTRLTGMFIKPKFPSKGDLEKPETLVACPGLTREDDARIEVYLKRSQAGGGGGTNLDIITAQELGKGLLFADVKDDDAKADRVKKAQEQTWRWTNFHRTGRVVAAKCLKKVPEVSGRLRPCSECRAILKMHAFQNAINKKMPVGDNAKYTPKRWQNEAVAKIYMNCRGLRRLVETDAKKNVFVRFAMGAMEGKYTNQVGLGLVHLMVLKQDREDRGVGLQNMKYPPAYDEMCQLLKTTSPSAYRLFQEYFPARSERSVRKKVSRAPKHPMTIGEEMFEWTAQQLQTIGYDGPVCLSCDDSALFKTIRLYFDHQADKYFLIGSTLGPLEVSNPDDMQQILDQAKGTKAVKLRLWCLQVEVPKQAPIIVGARAISDSLDAKELYDMTRSIVNGLTARKVKVVSCASDGTGTERSAQRLLVKNSEVYDEYSIANPRSGWPSLKIQLSAINGQLFVVMQDSKHSTKTLRNNLFSGARCLPMGNYVACYEHIAAVALDEGSPLYKRDVFKLDRQDDNAATRLFSAGTLEHLIENHPDKIGEIVYLFVFGELGDAYQNRSENHCQRLHMVLRARYFLDRWETMLDHARYPKIKYFLSPEARDILRMIIEGYIGLMFLHRDHVPSQGLVPFLPWLHSTEACEHVFGEARKLVKDFSMLDFIYMIPKLGISLRKAAFDAKSANPKATASGYNHTYLDNNGIDLIALSTYPSTEEIVTIAENAATEADTLISLLGVVPATVEQLLVLRQTKLPSIDEMLALDDDDDSVNELDFEDGEEMDPQIGIGPSQEIQALLDEREDSRVFRPRYVEETLDRLTMASVLVTAEEMAAVNAFANEDITRQTEDMADHDRQQLRSFQKELAAKRTLRPIQADDWDQTQHLVGAGQFSGGDLDLNELCRIRRRNQTKQAEKGVRVGVHTSNDSPSDERSGLRRQLAREFCRILREQSDQETAVGTGAERGLRHGYSAQTTGNAANAAAVANATASKALERRRQVFAEHRVPLPQITREARISPRSPLTLDAYGIVCSNGQIQIGKVIAIFSKTGGKNGKHARVAQASNISSVSYITVQLYDYRGSRGPVGNRVLQFKEKTTRLALLQTAEFAHIHSTDFLSVVSPPEIVGGVLTLTVYDSDIYNTIDRGKAEVLRGLKVLKARIPTDVAADDD